MNHAQWTKSNLRIRTLKLNWGKLRVANDNLSLAKFINELILNAFP